MGAKVALTITKSLTVDASGMKCYVMQVDLRLDGHLLLRSGLLPGVLRAHGSLPSRIGLLRVGDQPLPSSFNPQSLPLLAGYAGPSLGKRAAQG